MAKKIGDMEFYNKVHDTIIYDTISFKFNQYNQNLV
jgi:hypothetical protein